MIGTGTLIIAITFTVVMMLTLAMLLRLLKNSRAL
ncbi:hypothetical protein SAMN06264867_10594 [Halorubrum cibi]|uniref:Uncharacterized protein n=1 Tax=Halorubrum cibi TaxID=413815 RepID=A0A521CTQ3_9EURY|nr:hypothetical protein SAMN06264867_10594 [Halorubrum cibi]